MHKILFRGSKEVGKIFGIVAVAVTLVMGFAFGVGQQVMRSLANDPQVEIIESVSDALAQGQDPQAFRSLASADMAKSLSPFVIVYDESGKAVSGTAMLDGQTPTPSNGVFDVAKAKGENRLTWMPKKGVRIAAIVKSYSSEQGKGFVLAGKSLREMEARVKNLLKLSVIAWAGALIVSSFAINLLFGKKQEHQEHHPAHEPHG